MSPKVSIILPFFNAEDHLSEAIESMLCQTFEQFELILIDTKSTDRSNEIASEFTAQDSRVKLIEESRQGLVFGLNAGIDEAEGEFIAIMNPLDISYPERLAKQVEYLETHPDYGVIATKAKNTPETPESMYNEGYEQLMLWSNNIITHSDIAAARFIEAPFIHSTVMFRKELIAEHGEYRNGDFEADYELWLRWLSEGVKMYKLPVVLLDWLERPERVDHSEDRNTDQGLFEVKSRYLNNWLKENNKYYPNVAIWGAGKRSRQRYFILHELGVQAKFFIDLRENPERKVIQYQHTPPAGRNFILSYVANKIAREKLRMFLVELGYMEGKDFICMV